jgi:hypothetical protein
VRLLASGCACYPHALGRQLWRKQGPFGCSQQQVHLAPVYSASCSFSQVYMDSVFLPLYCIIVAAMLHVD